MNTITNNHTSEICNLLINAFEKDPMFVYLFSGERRRQYMNVFFKFLINKSQMLNEQLIGERMDEQWVTVANVELPSGIKSVSLMRQLRFLVSGLGLMFKIPFKTFGFINEYMRFTTSVRPKSPHHYLVFMGVEPKMQGRGLGRKALEYIHSLVDEDPLSTGIGLDTENPENVKLYNKFGYQLVAQKKIQGVTIYSMFRSKS
ncbi:MAG: GNAT family N-acetyltransferase [Bacillota bacterium]